MQVQLGLHDYLAILPIAIVTLFGVYLLLQGVLAPRMNRQVLGYIGVAGLALAFIANFFLVGRSETAFMGMLRVDMMTVILNFLFLVTAAFSLLMTISYSQLEDVEFIEFTPLILFSTVGMMLMGAAESLMTIFLGLETMSIALYVMAGFRRHNRQSLEAALKYFLLGAFATGFLLYGIALVYGAAGSSNLTRIAAYFSQKALNVPVWALVGVGLLIVGFGFKVALVPFHMWTPDVYQGAPMPVTGYMAVGAKAAGFAAILRVFPMSVFSISIEWTHVLWFLAVLTMTVGNILALVQDNIKRMLAYSSIAHAGYILVAVVANNENTVSSVLFYLIAYLLMNLGAFAVATLVAGENERRVRLEYYDGLAQKQPLLAFAMAVFMFSLAGFPPTVGFMGKFYIFSAALQSGYVWLVIIGVLNSFLSVYYYINVIVAMYMRKPVDEKSLATVLPGAGMVLLFTIIGILFFGIFPSTVLNLFH